MASKTRVDKHWSICCHPCKLKVGTFPSTNFPKVDVQAGPDVSWNDTLEYILNFFHLKLCLLSLELVGGAAPYEPPS